MVRSEIIVISIFFVCSISFGGGTLSATEATAPLIAPQIKAEAAVNELSCATLLQRPGVELVACQKLKVVILTGKPEVRAREFGRLLHEKYLDSQLIDYFANRLLTDIPAFPSFLRTFAGTAFNWYANWYWQNSPAEWRAELQAVAKGAAVDPTYLERGALLADLANQLNSYANDWPLSSLPPLGCTSVAKRLENGGFYYGRNLDFSSGGIWDEHPLIVVHIPEPGSKELRHIAFASDGLPFAGITGVNEKGLSFAVHQNYSRVKTQGIPMLLLGEMLLREANNLAEAQKFLEQYRPGPLWTFVITDLKSGDAIAVESSREAFNVRKMTGDRFVQTNHLLGEKTRELELIRPAVRANSEFRVREAETMLTTAKSQAFDAQAIFRTLAFVSDPRGELNGYHDILKPHTIQTIVLQKPSSWEDAAVSVSVDAAPTASGNFLDFRLHDLFFPEQRTGALAFTKNSGAAVNSAIRGEQILNAQALRDYFDLRQTEKAVGRVAHQTSLGARLFQACAQYELQDYARAFDLAQTALLTVGASSADLRVRDGLLRVAINAKVAEGKWAEAKALATKALDQGTDNVELLETIRFVNEESALPKRLRILHYDFFSGNLRTHPRATVP